MRLLLLAGCAVGALIAPAMAADMPIKAPRYVAPPLWSGFYVGLNAGWVDSQNSLSTVATPTPDAALGVIPGVSEGLAALSTGSIPGGNRSGFIGGGQIGYNWQASNWVFGLEADIQASGEKGSGSSTCAGGFPPLQTAFACCCGPSPPPRPTIRICAGGKASCHRADWSGLATSSPRPAAAHPCRGSRHWSSLRRAKRRSSR